MVRECRTGHEDYLENSPENTSSPLRGERIEVRGQRFCPTVTVTLTPARLLEREREPIFTVRGWPNGHGKLVAECREQRSSTEILGSPI
jgi:hypothetical protein